MNTQKILTKAMSCYGVDNVLHDLSKRFDSTIEDVISKITNKSESTIDDIEIIGEELGLRPSEYYEYFFCT